MKINYYLIWLSFLFISLEGQDSLFGKRRVNVEQLIVKNQVDVKGEDNYSCGYHALKNGIIIFKSLLEYNNISSKAQEELKSTNIVNQYFGSTGEWRNIVGAYRNKKLAQDYIYNYLIYSMIGNKEHVLFKDKREMLDSKEYPLRLNCGYMKFNFFDENLDAEKHLCLKNLFSKLSEFLVEFFEVKNPKINKLYESISYNFSQSEILNALSYLLKYQAKYSFNMADLKQYIPNVKDINFVVDKGSIRVPIDWLPDPIKFPSISRNINFGDDLSPNEIEYLLKKVKLDEYPICIIGDESLDINDELKKYHQNYFKELVNTIKNKDNHCTAIFLVKENHHWYSCVIVSNNSHINYYLTNSNANINISEFSNKFRELRDIIEEGFDNKSNQSNLENYLNPQVKHVELDKDKELILSSLKSPYFNQTIEDLPSLELLTCCKTATLINKIKLILKSHTEHRDKIKSGLIIYGPPGTGKTVLAEVICREANIKVFFISAGDLRTSYQASTQSILRHIIKLIEECSEPCAIVIDEIDAISSKPRANDHSEEAMTLAFLKTCTQALDNCKNKPYIFCTTNYIGKIDSAIKRRFKQVHISLPGKDRLGKIIKFYLHKNKDAKFINENIREEFISLIAKYSFKEKLSCDNIKDIINDAIIDESFSVPIMYNLPLEYTKGLWGGTEFEKRVYNSYCNFVKLKNNDKKEEKKEKNKHNINHVKTPILEIAKHAVIQGSIFSILGGAGYLIKKQYEKRGFFV